MLRKLEKTCLSLTNVIIFMPCEITHSNSIIMKCDNDLIFRLLRRNVPSVCWRSTTGWMLGATLFMRARSSKSLTFCR